MTKATIRVASWKVAVPLAAEALPRNLVPMSGPVDDPSIDLVLEDASLTARAKVNGKNYRRMLKQVDEAGAANVAIVLQGYFGRRPSRAGHSCSRVPASRST